MSMVIKSPSVVLRPPTTAAGEKISLSPLDKANFPLSVLLLYHPSPVDDAANTIKRALSQALVHYYPFCGRIVDGSHIECTGEGAVEFVAASADCSLKQAAAAKLHERPSFLSLVEELAVYYPMGSYGAADPLLTVQVTEFACGGFALGATWSHARRWPTAPASRSCWAPSASSRAGCRRRPPWPPSAGTRRSRASPRSRTPGGTP